MKYQLIIEISAPIDKVVEHMNEAENMRHWQQGLVEYRTEGEAIPVPGKVTFLKYNNRGREFELKETVVSWNPPEEMVTTYAMPKVFNTQANRFEIIDANTTRWISDCKFEFSGIMMKLMATLMPGAFKKQSMKFMQDFKNFVEKGDSVAQ